MQNKLQQVAEAAAGAYALGLNPMPAIRRLADAGAIPRIHYYAGQVSDTFCVGDFLLCLHKLETRLEKRFEVEINSTSVPAGFVPGPGEPGVRLEGAPELYVRCPGGVINWTHLETEVVSWAEAPVLV